MKNLTLTKSEEKLLVSAMQAAVQWEASYADAHELAGGRKIEPTYSRALRLMRRYEKLRDKVIREFKEDA